MKEPIQLVQVAEVAIHPAAPFNFDASLHKPDHFPSPDNEWQPGTRWQTMLFKGERLGLHFSNAGSLERPEIRLSVYACAALANEYLARLLEEIDYRYSFQLDLEPFFALFQDHPHLQPVIERWRGMRPLNCSSLYEYLMIAIVLQNATVRRSVSMMRLLEECYGTPLVFAGKTLWTMWQPEDLRGVEEAELRSLKVGYRAKAIRRVTEAFLEGLISEQELRDKPREEQQKALLSLYGVGPASVGYLMSDVFHHLDEMEHISPWEQKIYTKLFFDRDPENPIPVDELLGFFSRNFPGYRSLAVHYIWEDLFWQRRHGPVEWLEKLIRL